MLPWSKSAEFWSGLCGGENSSSELDMRDFPPSSGDSWFCLLPPALLFSLFSLEMTTWGKWGETYRHILEGGIKSACLARGWHLRVAQKAARIIWQKHQKYRRHWRKIGHRDLGLVICLLYNFVYKLYVLLCRAVTLCTYLKMQNFSQNVTVFLSSYISNTIFMSEAAVLCRPSLVYISIQVETCLAARFL